MIDRSLIRLDGMKKLIFDLLDLTRIESGQKQRAFAMVDLRGARRRPPWISSPPRRRKGGSLSV